MNFALPAARRLLAATATATATAILLPLASHAAPVTLFVPYAGEGNVAVFDPVAGTGGWVGSIDQSPFPPVPSPLSLVSVVLFSLDPSTLSLGGSFEFTTTDLASTLFGDVNGSYLDPDILVDGGQFSIDYTILGGTGDFLGASGFGLSFVDYDPTGAFNNYSEAGLLAVTVPEPASLALAGLALLAGLAVSPRRRGAALGRTSLAF